MGTAGRRARRASQREQPHFGIGLVAAGAGGILALGMWAGMGTTRAQAPAADAPWPAAGTAAVAVGDAVALSPGADAVRPMAGIARIVTALVVLDAAPLDGDGDGAVFVMDDLDETFRAQEAASGGTSVRTPEGTALSERTLLELMLVASSDNHARSLARHVFGSESAYAAAARAWLDARDLPEVEIADASGRSPLTRGSAQDLLGIARLAAADPVVAPIAASPGVSLPSGRSVATTNDLLHTLDVDGLVAGRTDAAGHTAAFTAPLADGERIVGVVLGEPSRARMAADVSQLLAHFRAPPG